MITIGQIAKIAKVSRYTASKVLNGDPSVRPSTRQKILTICKEHGYIPNLNAINLVKGRSNIIGLIVPYITDGFYSNIVELLEQQAQRRGYMLICKSSYNQADTEEEIIRKFLALKICALLVVPVVENPVRSTHELAAANVPVIYLDRPYSQDSYCVLNDNFASARMMTEHLLSRTDKVAFLDSFYGDKNPTAKARRSGYESAMKNRELPPQVIYGLASAGQQDNEYYAYQAIKNYLSTSPVCQALFCVTDAAAFGAAHAVREAGFTPGRDFFIGGHDNLRFGSHANPSITTIAQPIEQICVTAFNIITALLRGESVQPLQWVLPSSLIVRQSG